MRHLVSPPSATAPTPPPAGISLADVAGEVVDDYDDREEGRAHLVKYELVATGDTAGWTFNFPNRKPVPAHVAVRGDSIVIDAGPYESVLRKGVKSRPTAWLASRTGSWWAPPARGMPRRAGTRCAT